MPTVVGVRLRSTVKPVLVDTQGLEIPADGIVAVKGERGIELGRVVSGPRPSEEGESLDGDVRLDRVATPDDLALAEDLHRREKEAMAGYRRLVQKHGLDMKPIDVEYLFDGGRIVFYFVAEERVDFRDLVRDLASEFHARIDMRQVGVRDEARMIGGLGHCGEQLCCARFGGDFQPVSIRMAKEQDLPLNPLKISGLCGRLMCCLRYEFEAYKDFKGRAPRKGAIVEVGHQKGKVVDFNTPKERITMRLEEGGSITVDLADMDCASGQGCPCRVRAEALEKPASALAEAVAAVATITPATREKRAGGRGRSESGRGKGEALRDTAAVPAPEAAAKEAGSGRRRRRRGSGGGSASGAADAAQPATAGASQSSQRSRGGSAQRPAGESRQQAPREPQAAAGGDQAAAPSSSGRRRRRRRSGGSAAAGDGAGAPAGGGSSD